MINRRTCLYLTLLLVASAAPAQNVIGTFAGTTFLFPSDRLLPLSSPLGRVQDVAVDSLGNLYISDRDNHVVVKVSTDGTLATYAGNGLNGFSGDQGAAVNASLRTPRGLALDRAGNLYIADEFSHRVRRVAADGTITTFAGTGIANFTGEGTATSNAVNAPRGLALDAGGNLYIADSANHRVRRVTPAGFMTTIAGTGTGTNSGDGGSAAQAALNTPTAVAVDATGNLYIATTDRVRKVAPNGAISTLIITVGQFGLLVPSGLAVDSQNNLYVSSSQGASSIIRVAPDGTNTRIAGNGSNSGFSGDGGPALQAQLKNPGGLTIAASNAIFVADRDNFRVRRIDPDATIRTVAGNGRFQFSGDGERAAGATLSQPTGVAVDAAGNLFVTDFANNRVRKIGTDRIINTVAGSDALGFSGDGGPATQAALSGPQGVAADASGFSIADKLNNVVRKVDLAGIIRTIAGGGVGIGSNVGDGGPAMRAALRFPYALALDSLGNLYIADQNNDRIRRVAPDGSIATIAGGGNLTGDGVLAADAALNSPQGVAVDAQNRIYIADTDRGLIRVVENGRIRTIAGGGSATAEGAAALSARLDAPQGLAFDPSGNLHFAEFNANRIRRIVNGNVTTVAGIAGPGGFAGDGGLANSALLSAPRSIVFDAAGNLYIADQNNNRIRVVLAAPPPITVSPTAISFSAISGGLRTAPRLVNMASDQLSGLPFAAMLVNKSPWLTLFPASGPTPASLEISADSANLKPGVYVETIRITTPNAKPTSTDVTVQLTVANEGQPLQSVQPETLAFAFVLNSAAKTQAVTVANLGGGSIGYAAKAETPIAAKWLSVTPVSGTVTAATPSLLAVTATPGSLSAGTYSGTVTVTIGAQSNAIPVTMTISEVEQTIRLSQTGLTITGVEAGSVTPPQSFRVLNTGRGVMSWTASVIGRPGAPIVLKLTPPAGTSDAASLSIPSVTVNADLTGLKAGEYFNQIRVESPTALNSPQFLPVVLEVLERDRDPGPAVQPSELVFTGLAGASPPSSQDLLVYNLKGAALNYTSQRSTLNGIDWVTYLPTEAVVDPKLPRRIVVQPDTTLLTAGVQQGVLTIRFDDGNTRKINLLTVVLPNAAGATADKLKAAQSACTPKDLVLSVPALGQGFTVPVNYPVPLVVAVSDDCRNAMTDGSVTVSFSNGDVPLSLLNVGDGTWTATWVTLRNSTEVKLTVTARSKALGITKAIDLGGNTRPTTAVPRIAPGGIVNAADPRATGPNRPLAPGGVISIYGTSLANGMVTSPIPYRTNLGGTSVIVAGQELALTFASPDQVNAILPYNLNPNTDYSLVISAGDRVSDASKIVLAATQPVIFTTSLGPAIVDLKGAILTPANPARPGDTVLVFAAGLGAVLGDVTPGAVSGALATAAKFAVTVAGQTATVTYAGLSGAFPGLYQLNVLLPANLTPGPKPLVITTEGQSSPEVTIPIASATAAAMREL